MHDLVRAGRSDVARRFVEALERMALDPSASGSGVDLIPMSGGSGAEARLRVGEYRLFLELDFESHVIRTGRLEHRKRAYR